MTTTLIVSNIMLWFLVVGLAALVFALARQIGILHERVAPVGALIPLAGPKIGEKIELLQATALSGEIVPVGGPTDTRTLIYFLSPGCPVCLSLLPVVQKIEAQESDVKVLYASDGDDIDSHGRYADKQGINQSRYLLSQQLGLQLAVNKLPFAVLLDETGVLRARGLVNSREHIESLLNADEMDVPSLQEYLGQQSQTGEPR